jgi:hypothetical protein
MNLQTRHLAEEDISERIYVTAKDSVIVDFLELAYGSHVQLLVRQDSLVQRRPTCIFVDLRAADC